MVEVAGGVVVVVVVAAFFSLLICDCFPFLFGMMVEEPLTGLWLFFDCRGRGRRHQPT